MRYLHLAILLTACAEQLPCTTEVCDMRNGLIARAAPANDVPEFSAVVERLTVAGVWDEGCINAPVNYVILSRDEFAKKIAEDRITGVTWRGNRGWTLVVKGEHHVAGYDPSQTLEHEIMHALLGCVGEDHDASLHHVGAWWDGIR
jgi:hypothetical protein